MTEEKPIRIRVKNDSNPEWVSYVLMILAFISLLLSGYLAKRGQIDGAVIVFGFFIFLLTINFRLINYEEEFEVVEVNE